MGQERHSHSNEFMNDESILELRQQVVRLEDELQRSYTAFVNGKINHKYVLTISDMIRELTLKIDRIERANSVVINEVMSQ